MIRCVLFLSLLIVIFGTPNTRFHDPYVAQCSVRHAYSSIEERLPQRVPCLVSLYSSWQNISFQGCPVKIINSSLCSPVRSQIGGGDRVSVVAMVRRGECPFDVKTQHATAAGFAALVIVNTMEEPVHFGQQDSKQIDGIPTLMVGSSVFNKLLDEECETAEEKCSAISMSIEYVSGTIRTDTDGRKYFFGRGTIVPFIGIVCVGLIVIAITYSSVNCFMKAKKPMPKSSTAKSSILTMISVGASLVIILVVSMLLGCATLRKREVSDIDGVILATSSYVERQGDREIMFNHRETDELIFETLTTTISKSFWDYSLQTSGIVESFRLSKENYDDDIFIHPPFFVYSLYFMWKFFDIPLVYSSVIFHALTSALVFLLTLGVQSPISTTFGFRQSRSIDDLTAALWATLIYVCCPMGRLCSQKLWIDNAAAFTATFAAVFHIYILRNVNMSKNTIRSRNFFSGLIFGLIALNCKATSLALMPFLLSWTCFATLYSTSITCRSKVCSVYQCRGLSAVLACSFFLGGMTLGHGPWVYLYYITTGRLFPNAWPSKNMIESSLYLQAAVNRPFTSYVDDLLRFSPAQLVGLLFGSSIIVICALSFIKTAFSRKRNASGYLQGYSSKTIALCSFAMWPLSVIGGLTFIGVCGGGFQMRFLTIALPATSVLASLAMSHCDCFLRPLFSLILLYGGFHTLFYAILYPPLFSDMKHTVFDMIETILESPYRESSMDMSFLQHFGLSVK